MVVIIATPAAGAVLVDDSQVVDQPAAVDDRAPYGLGYRYTVVLAGVTPPQVGEIVMSTGEKPVGGRVLDVSTVGSRVTLTLEVVPLDSMFEELVVRESFDLSRAPIEVEPELSETFVSKRLDDGSIVFSPVPSAQKGAVNGTEVTQFVDCSDSTVTNPAQIISINSGAQLSFDPSLRVDLDYSSLSGDFSVEVAGGVLTSLDLRPRTTAAFEGKISCKLQLGRIPLPLAGALSYIFTAFFPLGAGVEVSGKVSLTETIGYDLTAVGGYQAELGLVCEPNCGLEGDISITYGGSARPVLPPVVNTSNNLQLELNGFLFGYADLNFGNPLLQSLSFSTFGAKAGVQQSGNFRARASQANDSNYASEFKLEAIASLGPANEFLDFLTMLQLTPPVAQLFSAASVLAESPKGTLVITDPNGGSSATPANPATVLVGSNEDLGEQATFTISLNNTRYVGNYIVEGVEIYERQSDGTGGFTLQPGRPGPQGLSQWGSPGRAAFQRAKSAGWRLPCSGSVERSASSRCPERRP